MHVSGQMSGPQHTLFVACRLYVQGFAASRNVFRAWPRLPFAVFDRGSSPERTVCSFALLVGAFRP